MESVQLMEIRGYQQMDYLIYEIFHTNLMVTTKQKIRAESQTINTEETEKTTKLKWQSEIREKKQWKYRTTGKQEAKWNN